MCQLTLTRKRKRKQKITLKQKRPKVEEKPTPSYIQASRIGNLDVIKKYIENGTDVNEEVMGCTALHYACFYNHIDIVTYLVENGANIDFQNTSGVTPFYWAVDSGHVEIVKYLIDKCDPSIADKFGWTPLHRALMNKNIEMVKILLSVNTPDEIWVPLNEKTLEEEFTALHYACLTRQPEMIDVLAKAGADMNCLSNTHNTPLHYAVFKNYIDIVEKLLQNSVDVNITDSLMRTPLHWACQAGNFEIALLLVAVTDVKLKDSNGETALDLATKNTHFDIVKLFP